MGGYFKNQVQDEAGVVGVTLQKLLIFFIFIDILCMFFGGSFMGSLVSLLFHLIVLRGVYKRRTCVLMMYVVINVIGFVFIALAVIFMTFMVSSADYNHDGISDNGTQTHNVTSYMFGPKAYFSFAPQPTPEPNSSSSDATSTSTSSADSSSYEQTFLYVAVIGVVISLVILYCKIFSIVLAHRMRKMLLAAKNLPTYAPVPTSEGDDEKKAPLRLPEEIPIEYTYPGNYPEFIPFQPATQHPMFYPNMQVPPHAMMPPHFMYGQHPVFYTFAPQGSVNQNDNEKL